jgi:NAD(P)-dependent dehydrogenase (short-subunit alcohol dehydrogenase family)
MKTLQLFDLAGRMAVVTGGNGGIGRGETEQSRADNSRSVAKGYPIRYCRPQVRLWDSEGQEFSRPRLSLAA